jgi:hypothetical protein
MQVSKKNSTKLAHSSSAKHYAKGSTPTNNGGCNGHGGQDKDSEVMAVGKNNSSYNLI